MKRRTTIPVAAGLLLAAIAGAAAACSTLCLETDASPVFAKNYDWNVPDGFVVVNPAGAVKTAALEGDPAQWKSRYGSVTFNQYGREYPCGGINEAGLVIELMWLEETGYPAADARPAIPTLQWIQYQLDNSATVEEVLGSNTRVRIEGRAGLVHFLVADASGEVAAVEFLDGVLVAHSGDLMPFPVLTNDTYARSLSFLRTHEGYGGERHLSRSTSSLDRFVVAADRAASYDPRDGDPISYAFETLDMVAQGAHTKWSIVYDIGARRVYARTSAHRSVRWLDLDDLDFSCERPAQIVDLQAPLEGDLSPHLEDYTTAANSDLMRSAFAQTRFLSHISGEAIRQAARYPETITCEPLERSSR